MVSKAFCSPQVTAFLVTFALASVFIPARAADPQTASGIGATTAPAAAASEASKEAPPAIVENSLIKVFSTIRYPDPYKPWTKQAPTEVTGSGVVIDGKRILTNAHVVSYAGQVQVQANQAGDKVSATVEAIALDIDLAVLKLDDDSFFDSHPPIAREKVLPQIKDAVMVYGYPTGGTTLSITKGIVSRIEFSAYHASVSGLRIQIDAAINPGNSGGPAIAGGKMIGLAFSRLGEAENIGYIIPCEEIDLFLDDVAHGAYKGKPGCFDEFQTLENPALRAFLKLDKSVQGMVVHHPSNTDPDYPLKQWDVVTRIGDTPVDDQGMITINNGLRVRFTYMVQKLVKDGKVPLTVVRGNQEVKIDLPVLTKRAMVVPDLDGAYPSYFLYGPIVFSEATSEFIGGFLRGNRAANVIFLMAFAGNSLVTRAGDKPAFEGERLVIISSPFFPHKLSQGYGNAMGGVVKSINDIPIKNLGHLIEVLRDMKDEFITIEFKTRGGETMVFRRTEMLAATEEIMTDNGVRTQGSPDALAVWNAKKDK
jgi:S1-C subfamily serine protease